MVLGDVLSRDSSKEITLLSCALDEHWCIDYPSSRLLAVHNCKQDNRLRLRAQDSYYGERGEAACKELEDSWDNNSTFMGRVYGHYQRWANVVRHIPD